MKTKGILQRARKWLDAVGHWGRLGRAASNRSFLLRERKKLLIRVGETTLVWIGEQKSPPPQLTRLVAQLEKIDAVLKELDYGGKDGVDFSPKTKKTDRKKGS